jgi:tubulin alpha
VILVDLEPIPIDEIRTGCYRSLFDPSTLITSREDAASNFGRGYNSLGSKIIDLTLERVRRVAESCECLQGFITFRSIGGGTGSGFGTLLQEKVSEDFEKSSQHEFNIFPSPKWVARKEKWRWGFDGSWWIVVEKFGFCSELLYEAQ